MRKRGRVDGVLVMLWVAAVLGALALAGPGWRRGVVEGPKARVVAFVRSTGGGAGETELFLKVAEGEQWPGNVEVGIQGSGPTVWESVASGDLRAGRIFLLDGKADAYTVTVRVQGRIVDVFTFSRAGKAKPFSLLTQTDGGRVMDPALVRAFALLPGAHRDDPTVQPSVVLVDSRDFDVAKVAPDSLLVVSAETPLPGIQLGERMSFSGGGAVPLAEDLPAFVDLRQVRVREMMGASLSPEWTVMASVAGHPWLAERRFSAKGPTVCWMASRPSSQSTWGVDPSFVLYCAELREKTFPASGTSAWDVKEESLGKKSTDGAVVELGGVLGLLAMGLIVAAMGAWARRLVR